MKKFIIILSVLFFSISLSSQTTNWEESIKRLEKTIASQEKVIKDKTAQIDSINSDDSLSLRNKKKQVLILKREIEEISVDIEVSKSVIKTYQKLLEKEKEDKMIAEQKAKEAKEAQEQELEKERLRSENAKKREEEFRASVKKRMNQSSQPSEPNLKESN